MFDNLKKKLTYFKFFVHFKKYLNILLAKKMKNVQDGKHELTLFVGKKDNVLKIISSDKVCIEIDGETEELPFSLAMFMLNEISSNYLKAMRVDMLRQTFRKIEVIEE